jgi:hypothetical protein
VGVGWLKISRAGFPLIDGTENEQVQKKRKNRTDKPNQNILLVFPRNFEIWLRVSEVNSFFILQGNRNWHALARGKILSLRIQAGVGHNHKATTDKTHCIVEI